MSDRDLEHGQLQEGDLLAYLDGVASPSVARHITACSRCRVDLAGLRAADALLSAALLRADCPAADDLLAFQAGFLAGEEASAVQAHAATCAECRADLALIADPPAPRFRDQLARAGARLIQATLMPAPAAAPALRGSAPQRATYAADGFQLLLAITPAATADAPVQIEGQLLGADDLLVEDAVARLIADEQEYAAEPIDDLGFFAFDSVAPGVYSLALVFGNTVTIIDPITTTSASA
ncbi:MAG: zf-HC2 domain-containing protein [Oscillochloris sp.]|nr:zf-HC2 domain-containing protein [Oscillochloris sp.]